MRTIYTLIALLLFGMSSVAFVYPQDWVEFETQGCKMLFPGKPGDESQKINTAIGEMTMRMHMYEVPDGKKDENLLYGLIETEYPADKVNSDKKEIIDEFFKSYTNGAVSKVNGTLLSESKIQIDGYPGNEIRINFSGGAAVIVMRSYLVKNKMFILQTIALPANDHNKSMDRFLNSFALKK
jgi:hypothetical protein